MADQVLTQVRFKRALWKCPKCGTEETEELNVSGGNSYEHTCSKCSEHFNQSGENMKLYDGLLTYTAEEYSLKNAQDITDAKTEAFESWVESSKQKPPAAVFSLEDNVRVYRDLVEEVKTRLSKIAEQSTEKVVSDLKNEISSTIAEVIKD